MKLSHSLLILGVVANIMMYLLVMYYGKAYVLLIYGSAILWAVVFILAVILFFIFKNRSPDNTALRVLGFVICTPLLSFSPLFNVLPKKKPETVISPISPTYEFKNGFVWKYQEMSDVGGADYVITIHKAVSLNLEVRGIRHY